MIYWTVIFLTCSIVVVYGLPQGTKIGCGIRNINGVGFSINDGKDNEAQFGEFPWMVAILREEPVLSGEQKSKIYTCGGSLIHPKVVMTAAHCVGANTSYTTSELQIRAGEWDTQTNNEIFPHQDRGIKKIIRHSDHNPGNLHNDIALLILDSPVNKADNIGYICLPSANVESSNSGCFVTGWGQDVPNGKYQPIPKRIELPIVAHDQCQTELRKTRLGTRFELHPSFICAGGKPENDACKGDGGSSLVCPLLGRLNHFTQSGIVSWGIGCGTNTPGVYTNVGAFRNWIDKQLLDNNIDMTQYQLS